ncbi:MAG: Hsp20/alpha crystallin family protein, partial [Lachnospiraceae bacterium]|nr:Hsp20/alpha crystallin family protein [Lachnospiraceae bacterium]
PSLFDEFFFDAPKSPRRPSIPQIMKTDVKESDGGYDLEIELPGYKKEDLQLELKDGYLNVVATTKQNTDDQDKNGHYIRRERYIGTSSRSFYVGDEVTENDIKAKFEDGVLNIYVPKKEEQPKVPESKYISIE